MPRHVLARLVLGSLLLGLLATACNQVSGSGQRATPTVTPTATATLDYGSLIPTAVPYRPLLRPTFAPYVAPTIAPWQFIPYPGNGGGPTLCRDGMYSHSSGRGTCSHHGGIAR